MPFMLWFAGKEARRDYWSGRVVREVANALRLLAFPSRHVVTGDWSPGPNQPSDPRAVREVEIIEALRRRVTPEVAELFDLGDGFCAADQLHMHAFPGCVSLPLPRGIAEYLSQGTGYIGQPDIGGVNACSRGWPGH